MDDIKLKKALLFSRQILLYFVDFHRNLPFFDKSNIYRIPLKEYDKFRLEDKEKFRQELYRLKKQKLIKIYIKNKEKQIELTNKGQEKLKKYILQNIELKKPGNWDQKWRIVIFDIPNHKKVIRNMLREKLINFKFIELQESVYVHPFDCLKEIDLIKNMYFIESNVQYILADRIETEVNLIKKFIDLGVLEEKTFLKN